ncbi:hypothetical protein, partial [Telluribacter humicola]
TGSSPGKVGSRHNPQSKTGATANAAAPLLFIHLPTTTLQQQQREPCLPAGLLLYGASVSSIQIFLALITTIC